MRTIYANIHQAIRNKGFWIGVIGTVVILLLSLIEDFTAAFRSKELLGNGTHAAMIVKALTSDAMTFALPILCTLPFTTAFLDDMKSGYIKEYLPRTTTNRYLAAKSIACGLSGGMVLAIGGIVAYGICAMVFCPMEAALQAGAESMQYGAEIWGKLGILFCSGVFWAMLGLLFATLTNSRYMAYAAPFVVYYVLIILKERYFTDLYVIYPKEWLSPTEQWVMGKWGIILLLAEMTVIAASIFCIVAKRRIRQI